MNQTEKNAKKNFFLYFEIQDQGQFCDRFFTMYFHQIGGVEFIYDSHGTNFWPVSKFANANSEHGSYWFIYSRCSRNALYLKVI